MRCVLDISLKNIADFFRAFDSDTLVREAISTGLTENDARIIESTGEFLARKIREHLQEEKGKESTS